MAAMKRMSTRLILVLSLKSYQLRWSSHCRSSSMGGWAPYTSREGMFMSSTNTTWEEAENV